MRLISKTYLFALVMLMSGNLLANQDSFNKANELYVESRYEKSITQYNTLLEEGFVSPVLYYNLGNAYYQNNELANAILNYEKAIKLDPNNEAAAQNLIIARTETADGNTVLPELVFVKWWKSAATVFSSDKWAMLVLLMVGLLSAMWLMYKLTNTGRVKSALSIAVIGNMMLLLIASIFLYSSHKIEHSQNYGIVMLDKTNILAAPDTDATETFTLNQGAKVRVVDRVENWTKIKVDSDNFGWVLNHQIELI